VNLAILFAAAQALASVPPSVEGQPQVGARVSAVATVEILSAATTRDQVQDRPIARHRRAGGDGRIMLEFE
jgi:hypothetical protein